MDVRYSLDDVVGSIWKSLGHKMVTGFEIVLNTNENRNILTMEENPRLSVCAL